MSIIAGRAHIAEMERNKVIRTYAQEALRFVFCALLVVVLTAAMCAVGVCQ